MIYKCYKKIIYIGNDSHTIHVEYIPGTSDSAIPATLANATITVGTLGVEHTRDIASMVVTSFLVSKTN